VPYNAWTSFPSQTRCLVHGSRNTGGVVDYEPQKRPGLTFLGFLVSFALFGSVKLAYNHEWFAGLRWHGGEYAYLFTF
jgi:hypothetical protein